MGIVLKRRDNAPILYMQSGIIDILMATGDIDESINFLQRSMMNLINGEFSMELLIISKSLKPTAAYADQNSTLFSNQWVKEIQLINQHQMIRNPICILK